MKKLVAIIILIPIWVLYGCAIYNQNLTDKSPYSNYTNREVVLKKDMILVEDEGSYNPYSPIELVEPGYSEGNRKRVRELPKGSKVWIDRVHWVNGIDSAWVTAVGKTKGEEEIVFEYYLGGYRGELRTPPWEEPNKDRTCYIGWEGEVTNENPRSEQ